MNRLQKAALWAAQKAATISGLRLTDPAFYRFFGRPTYSGKTVTQETALGVSALFSCVRIISETLGQLPLKAYKKDALTGNAVEVDTPSRDVLVTSPNIDMTSAEMRETYGANLCLAGNFYTFKDLNGAGNISSIYPIDSQYVTPMRAYESGDIVYGVYDRGKTEEFPREKIWHVKGFGSNGLIGYSPLGYARQAIGMALATEEFGGRFFGQGTNPSMVFSIPNFFQKKEQREEAYKKLEEFHSGLQNSHKPFIMEGGMTYARVQMPLDDAQFLVTRKFTIAEICRFYRVPLHMVMEMEGSTNNNIEHQGLGFVTYTLAPYMTRMEQSISKWLLSPKERAQGVYYSYDFDALLRADTPARAEFYSKMVQNGIYNRNEVRAKENMPAVKGLEKYTVQSNMTDLDKLDDLTKLPAAKKPPVNPSGSDNNAA